MPSGYDIEKYERMTAEMRRRLQSAIKRNLKIIWLDEVMFTKQTNQTHEWSRRNHNIWVPVESLKTKYTADATKQIVITLFFFLFFACLEFLLVALAGSPLLV